MKNRIDKLNRNFWLIMLLTGIVLLISMGILNSYNSSEITSIIAAIGSVLFILGGFEWVMHND